MSLIGANIWAKCVTHVTCRITPPQRQHVLYEAVFGMNCHQEVSTPATQQVISDDNYDQLEDPDAHLEESTSEIIEDNNKTSKDERHRKRIKISENQTKYNKKMVQQSEMKSAKKCNQFKVGDVVSIKIDSVDKTSLFHPSMLL